MFLEYRDHLIDPLHGKVPYSVLLPIHSGLAMQVKMLGGMAGAAAMSGSSPIDAFCIKLSVLTMHPPFFRETEADSLDESGMVLGSPWTYEPANKVKPQGWLIYDTTHPLERIVEGHKISFLKDQPWVGTPALLAADTMVYPNPLASEGGASLTVETPSKIDPSLWLILLNRPWNGALSAGIPISARDISLADNKMQEMRKGAIVRARRVASDPLKGQG